MGPVEVLRTWLLIEISPATVIIFREAVEVTVMGELIVMPPAVAVSVSGEEVVL